MARPRASKIAVGHTTPLPSRKRAADAIVEDLRSQIAAGKLPHGARLPAERTLAERYSVSGPTVREALQGLSAMGLLDVRHGSGTYISALAHSLVAKSLGTVIQLEKVSIQDIIGLLGALNVHAARLAVDRATDADIAALDDAVTAIEGAGDVDTIVRSLRSFVERLSAAAHDPLLLAISRFLLDVQLELALELSEGSYPVWHGVSALLQPDRVAIIDALERRDAASLVDRVSAFHSRAVELIGASGILGDGSASPGRLARILARLIES